MLGRDDFRRQRDSGRRSTLVDPGVRNQNPLAGAINFGPVYDPSHKVIIAQTGFGGRGAMQLTLVSPELGFEHKTGSTVAGDPVLISSLSGDEPAKAPEQSGVLIVSPDNIIIQRGDLAMTMAENGGSEDAKPARWF